MLLSDTQSTSATSCRLLICESNSKPEQHIFTGSSHAGKLAGHKSFISISARCELCVAFFFFLSLINSTKGAIIYRMR